MLHTQQLVEMTAVHSQGHCSHPHHEVHHCDGFEEANRDFFDTPGVAERYAESSDAAECARRLAAAMLEVYPFNEEKTSVMDFACGVG